MKPAAAVESNVSLISQSASVANRTNHSLHRLNIFIHNALGFDQKGITFLRISKALRNPKTYGLKKH